jgi:regulator of cell morphogenesis and NO signaling
MEIRPETRVADLATQYPATIRVFQRHGIDFCCGGKRPLREVCDDLGVDLDDLTRDLEAAVAGPGEPRPAWPGGSVEQLIQGIVDGYHRPMDEELPRLDRMMSKVLLAHAERHP